MGLCSLSLAGDKFICRMEAEFTVKLSISHSVEAELQRGRHAFTDQNGTEVDMFRHLNLMNILDICVCSYISVERAVQGLSGEYTDT